MEKRTQYCGLITEEFVGQEVIVKGWVNRRRDLGGLIFIHLRDREGILQIVFNHENNPELFELAESVRNEYILEVKGTVVKREEDQINPNIKTGTVELEVSDAKVLAKAKTPPFYVDDENTVADELRMKYRFIDLRKEKMLNNLKLRHQTTRSIRNYLDEEGFMDVETPYLTKSTPEGARDYVVPSRVHPGTFYALPQSPQLFKQLLMGAGIDRYYQIVRCFRDEDLRGDRQPEFTQVDLETSFLSAEEIQTLTENMLKKVTKDTLNIDIPVPFPRMTYAEAMNRFGSDKPDTRFGLELIDLEEFAKETSFNVFKQALANGGQVKGLNLKGRADSYSRKDMDGLTDFIKQFGAKGLAWVKVTEDGLTGAVAKFFADDADSLIQTMDAEVGDLLMFVADKKEVVAQSLGELRLKFGREFNMIDESKFNFLWVVDWPLLEYDEDEKRFVALHHPFTQPKEEDVHLLSEDPAAVHAQAYDIVLNGYEIGGGSLRIFTREVQEKMFAALGFTPEEAEAEFGFLLEAFDYGFPPHGGIALGLDRLVMLLAGENNIREVIAFPKNGKAYDPMTKAPDEISDNQLQELNLRLTIEE
ncbi:aspartate--tRNA ligase [Jeotgalibaca ciconiae]|uniref:Aspartate--tRNA ligase n=1 Tax=Jeotgalibaca ciconiae TaxID=2496265 RepID=A0A3S9HDQ1_9LACT|nr:aspartate--tRNA ligase [Jeotgalibaca ciconiae]AZP05461.1 aspartate--tRNA ligase [Jeotgalibaca ciconiae]HJB24169.1 aspartate--tRNA ligase [Candidatus Jeotgalibaca pullicola]